MKHPEHATVVLHVSNPDGIEEHHEHAIVHAAKEAAKANGVIVHGSHSHRHGHHHDHQ